MKTLVKYLAAGAAIVAVTAALAGSSSLPTRAQTAPPTPGAPAALSSATLKALQEALNKQGSAVKVDGVLGNETRAAIRQYQSQHHLPVTGEPDPATLDKLGVAVQLRATSPAGSGKMQPGGAMKGQGMMGKGMMEKGVMKGGAMPQGQGTSPGQGMGQGSGMAPGSAMPKQ